MSYLCRFPRGATSCRTCAASSRGCDIVSYLLGVLRGCDIMSYLRRFPRGATSCRTCAGSQGVRHHVVPRHALRGATSCRTCAASPRGCDIVSYLRRVPKGVRHRVVPAPHSQGVRHCVVPMLRSQGGTTSCRTCAAFPRGATSCRTCTASSRGYDIMSYLCCVLKGVRHCVVPAPRPQGSTTSCRTCAGF